VSSPNPISPAPAADLDLYEGGQARVLGKSPDQSFIITFPGKLHPTIVVEVGYGDAYTQLIHDFRPSLLQSLGQVLTVFVSKYSPPLQESDLSKSELFLEVHER